MKLPLVAVLAGFMGIAATGARGQFLNFPAADRVLGQPDFTTTPSGPLTPSDLYLPVGLAVDPITGKLFVSTNDQHRILRFPDAATLESGWDGSDAEGAIGSGDGSNINPGNPVMSFKGPGGIHVDRQGRLWVADTGFHRVLMFVNASTRSLGFAPNLVLGQPDFVTDTTGISATKMHEPSGVFVDATDNLWVADNGNHRVLKFANASSLANGAAATSVLGQPDLDTRMRGTSACHLAEPTGLAVDGAGRLWVADYGNSRVLRYDRAATLTNGSAATAVLGQPDFVTSSYGTTAWKVELPFAVLVDTYGTLYVSDFGNHRVLVFRDAARKGNGAAADRVIGQPDFNTGTGGNGDTTARTLYGPTGMALDRAGHLWIAATHHERVLRFSPDWTAAKPRVTGRVPKVTPRAVLPIKGTAADQNGIAQIRYRVGAKAAFRTAKGTTAWRFTARLKPRKLNLIEVVAVDTVGNVSAPRKLQVIRRVKRR